MIWPGESVHSSAVLQQANKVNESIDSLMAYC